MRLRPHLDALGRADGLEKSVQRLHIFPRLVRIVQRLLQRVERCDHADSQLVEQIQLCALLVTHHTAEPPRISLPLLLPHRAADAAEIHIILQNIAFIRL